MAISRKGNVVDIMTFSPQAWEENLEGYTNYFVYKTSFPQILLKLGIRAVPSTAYLVLYVFLSFTMLASLMQEGTKGEKLRLSLTARQCYAQH